MVGLAPEFEGSTRLTWYNPAEPGLRPAYNTEEAGAATPFTKTCKLLGFAINEANCATSPENVDGNTAPSPVA